jgi:hypothetical protein
MGWLLDALIEGALAVREARESSRTTSARRAHVEALRVATKRWGCAIVGRPGTGALPFHSAVSTPYCPVGAAEFPNDNPGLHQGARWVCRSTVGAARAVLRPSATTPLLPGGGAPAGPRQAADATWHGAEAADPVARALRLKGPLQLVLDRVVLRHRREDIPPPPDFVFLPFVRSSSLAAMPEGSPAVLGIKAMAELAAAHEPLARIEPRPCRVVDARDARARVDRGWRVDIAPCLSIVSSELGSAPPALTNVVARASRRRGRLAARALVTSAARGSEQLREAIVELDAAFAQPALCCVSDEGTGVGPCRARGG